MRSILIGHSGEHNIGDSHPLFFRPAASDRAHLECVPEGWRAVGPLGTRDVCLEWISVNWTDMRPLSARAALSA